jgi:hypothetical protein
MFSLHETQQKRLCRWAFAAFCLVPTLATLAWVGVRLGRGSDDVWRQALVETFWTPARVTGARESRPGMWRIDRVELDAPSTPLPALVVHDLQIDARRAGRRVAARTAELRGAALGELLNALQASWAHPAEPLDWYVERLAWELPAADAADGAAPRAPTEPITWHAVRIRWQRHSTEDGMYAVVRLQAQAGHEAPAADQLLQLTWRRRLTPHAETTLRIDTSPAGLPLSLFEPLTPGCGPLRDARFAGALHWQEVGGNRSGRLEGRLLDAPLSALTPGGSPHRFDGRAAVELAECRWQNDRWEALAGSLRAQRGCFSRSLWQAAQDRLFCLPPPPSADSPTLVPEDGLMFFDQLACRFRFDRQGLALAGDCVAPDAAESAPAALAMRGDQPLLLERYVLLPAGAWLQFLELEAPSWLPATRAALETAQRLPLP